MIKTLLQGVTMPLKDYARKRNFHLTTEPSGKGGRRTAPKWLFVVQKHAASHLHYDFRLELRGVLKSWAVPKGPSLNPADKRLAVHVEDHPLDYATFEGVIPAGQYGGGTVMVWDIGEWKPLGDAEKSYRTGKLEFELFGTKLQGLWALVRMKGTEKNWLLIKKSDDYANTDIDVTEAEPLSALTGRTMEEIKENKKTKSKKNFEFKKLSGTKKTKMPAVIHPELATATTPLQSDNWIHEVKFDGYRIISFIKGKNISLITRREQNWTNKFPTIAAALKNIPLKNTILDGELVAVDEKGISRFQLLQNVLEFKEAANLVYYVFDIIYYEGYDLTHVPLIERKSLLKSLFASWPNKPEIIRYSDEIEGQGDKVFQQACEYGLEGIISKRKDSFYQQRRTRDWTKSKCLQRQEFVIGGFTDPERSRQYFGSLLLGYYDDKKHLIYCGHVGTGFDQKTLAHLYGLLSKIEQKKTPFFESPRVKNTHWVKPELVVEVEFFEWTKGNILRQPSYQGLRRDKKPLEVKRDVIVDMPASDLIFAGVAMTHPEKILFQHPKVSKADLADFYQEIAAWILPYMINRPLTLLRCPQGVGEKCFFQKNVNETVAKGVYAVTLPGKEGKRMAIHDLEGLIGLVQMNVLEIHPWGSLAKNPEVPDQMIFDLDPHEDVAWKDIINTALLLHKDLKAAGLESFVKTTGGKGLHVVVPLTGNATWDDVVTFSKSVAEVLVQQNPQLYTATMSKTKRQKKIFIDYLRNMKGATAIAPYCVRAREGAPIATPVAWEELKTIKRADQFTISNLISRLDKLKKDPWQDFFKLKQKLKL